MRDADHSAHFAGRDLAMFWQDTDYAREAYLSDPFSAELLEAVQVELGYQLPSSYVALMRSRNGGIPRDTCCPAPNPTSWAPDHITISGILGIGRENRNSLCGSAGSNFWVDEWGYPPIGVYFAECPSAGHDMVAMDYTECGSDGEPQVVHVDQELDYRVTVLAPNFAVFVQSLRPEADYPLGNPRRA